jgi:hypothetical protein
MVKIHTVCSVWLTKGLKTALVACLMVLSWELPEWVAKEREVASVTIAETGTRQNRVYLECKSSTVIILGCGVSRQGSQWHRTYISVVGNIIAFVNLKINAEL